VHAFNQRSVAAILDMIHTLGAIVNASERARELAAEMEARLADVKSRADGLPKRPRGFFEGWDDPLISGIGWVSELIETAGGIDGLGGRAGLGPRKGCFVTLGQVVGGRPDLIIGSWCGKKFGPERVTARPGFAQLPAVLHQDIYEIKSPLILQPGPAALTDGLAALQGIIEGWANRT